MEQVLVVAALVVKDSKFLIVQRESQQQQGSRWEFPGGKVDPGEDPVDTISREIMEELAVVVHPLFPVATSSAVVGDTHLVMILFLCDMEDGEIDLRVGQEYRWITREQLYDFDWAVLDVPMLGRVSRFLEGYLRE